MKTIFLITTLLLLPLPSLAGGYHHSTGYTQVPSRGHMYRATRYYCNSSMHYTGHCYHSHYRGAAFTGPAFDFSAYPTGGNYRPDPPDFKYQSITPGGVPVWVHTWTDETGTVHFTDDPGKAWRK